ncbi:MAG: 2-polyprenyl-6-methoxyphenol hydroxylase-like FAD-dependent oxidoreductase [Limisphaerales bacterium]|jgi:2-polyprenyl-6-methoxyphenol hydroxylase-like FAD-dependent oxidoreductase
MYPIAIQGSDIIAQVIASLCKRSGFTDISMTLDRPIWPPALTLGAHQTRILQSLGLGDSIRRDGHVPDREQVRLARSEYLVSEFPLGKFYEDRYGAPLVNITHDSLHSLVVNPWPTTNASPPVLNIETRGETFDKNEWHLQHSYQAGEPSNANVTWLGRDAVGWQSSTVDGSHFYVLTNNPGDLSLADWSPRLHAFVENLKTVNQFATQPDLRTHWQDGDWVFLGKASLSQQPINPVTWLTGLEDAWVLSRMMENYEQDIEQGTRAYAQYRQPRAKRILTQCNNLSKSYFATTTTRRVTRNLGIALRSRFLPEIAMQRIDWLHGFDCIKGFN